MGAGKRLGLRDVRALQPGETIWDATVPGFGVRRQKGVAVAYVLFYRTAERRQRWHTIGRHGAPWTPEQAREEARRILGRVAMGADPAAEKQVQRRAVTMAELCERYLADAESGRLLIRGGRPKKMLTLVSDRGRIDGHIVPLLGRLAVAAVTRQDVERFMHAVAAGETARSRKTKPRGVSNVRGGRGVASRAVSLLGAIFTLRWTTACALTTPRTGYGNSRKIGVSGAWRTLNMRRLALACVRRWERFGCRRLPVCDS
jgi:hypothetical protein